MRLSTVVAKVIKYILKVYNILSFFLDNIYSYYAVKLIKYFRNPRLLNNK